MSFDMRDHDSIAALCGITPKETNVNQAERLRKALKENPVTEPTVTFKQEVARELGVSNWAELNDKRLTSAIALARMSGADYDAALMRISDRQVRESAAATEPAPPVSDTRSVEDLRSELDATGWDWKVETVKRFYMGIEDRPLPPLKRVEATTLGWVATCGSTDEAEALRMTLAAINAAKEAN